VLLLHHLAQRVRVRLALEKVYYSSQEFVPFSFVVLSKVFSNDDK
jgi:hypothetical protein